MVSHTTSIPPSKGAIGTAPPNPTPLEDESEAMCYPASNAASPPFRPSNVSTIPEYPSNIPDSIRAERGVALSDGRIPIPVKEDDVVIAVMGPTGVGKSSFVNTAAGREEVAVGHSLLSQTRMVQPVRCSHPDGHRNIVLVDTPGFDDTHLSDVQVLTIIADWLKRTYQGNIKLSGLLYFHRISDVRFAGTPLRNLSVFKDLCGETNLQNVALVTTMWDEVDDEAGSKREQELMSEFWKDMIRLGSQSYRFHGTCESAWDIMGRFDLEGPRREPALLQIQEEMVDRGFQIHETTAGKTLLGFLLQELKRFWGRVRTRTHRLIWFGKPFRASWGRPVPNMSSTSTLSEFSSRVSSPTDTSSLYSHHLPSPVESTSVGCNVDDRRPTLVATIAGLRLAHQVADIAGVPILRGAIGTALHVAQLIEGIGGTHHAIGHVIDQSGWLLKEIAQYAAQSTLTKDLKKSLKSFKKELENVRKVVMEISSRSFVTRFLLHDAEVQAITACAASIKAIHAKIEVKIAIDSRQAVARLEDQLKGLRDDLRLRQCRCGSALISEESRRNGEHSAIETTTRQL